MVNGIIFKLCNGIWFIIILHTVEIDSNPAVENYSALCLNKKTTTLLRCAEQNDNETVKKKEIKCNKSDIIVALFLFPHCQKKKTVYFDWITICFLLFNLMLACAAEFLAGYFNYNNEKRPHFE